MKPLIFVYCYYDESHNVLDTKEVFPYVELIIRKTYDFYHVNTLINLSTSTTKGLSYSPLDHFSSYVLVIMGSLLY